MSLSFSLYALIFLQHNMEHAETFHDQNTRKEKVKHK